MAGVGSLERMDTGEACKLVRTRVGKNVDGLLGAKGLSQSKLAAMIGVDRSHLNQLIGGKSNVTLDVLVKIADGLGVPLTELFFGLDSKTPCKLTPRDLKIDYDKGNARP